MIDHRIRLRIQITRLDHLQPRLWQLVRHDLGAQLRGFFQFEPEIGRDQDALTTYMIAVTPDTARVGLNAPAFALAIRKMVNEYGLPQRFGVGVAIVRLPEGFSHDQKRMLIHSVDLAPAFAWLEIIETAEG